MYTHARQSNNSTVSVVALLQISGKYFGIKLIVCLELGLYKIA